MYKGAISVIFSELMRKDRLKVVSDFEVAEPKTKNITSLMKSLNLKDALLMTDELDENLYLASRNVKNIECSDIHSINPVSLLKYEKVLMSLEAVSYTHLTLPTIYSV